MPSQVTKDPSAVLDFAFEWSDWLADSEEITSHTVTVPSGITLDSTTADTTSVTAWLSGGTAGETYSVVCQVSTNQSRTDERTMTVRAQER